MSNFITVTVFVFTNVFFFWLCLVMFVTYKIYVNMIILFIEASIVSSFRRACVD